MGAQHFFQIYTFKAKWWLSGWSLDFTIFFKIIFIFVNAIYCIKESREGCQHIAFYSIYFQHQQVQVVLLFILFAFSFLSSPTLLVFIVFGLLTSVTSSLYLFLLTYRCLLFLPLIFFGFFVTMCLESGDSVPNTRTLYIPPPFLLVEVVLKKF